MTAMIIFILLILAVIFLILFTLWLKSKNKIENDLPYQKTPIFNQGERNFYNVLRLIIKDDFIIFTKIRLIDLLKIEKNGEEYQKYKNKVSQKHIDFILCDVQNYEVKLAIELDGKHHAEKKQIDRDDFKNKILEKIKIPLLRITAKNTYNPSELKEQIYKIIYVSEKKTLS